MDTQTLPERPLLKPWYRLAEDGGRLLFEYGHSVLVFEGEATTRLLPAMLPLLDGAHTVGEIVRALGEAAEPAIVNALLVLDRHRLLTEAPPEEGAAGSELEAAEFLVATARRRIGLRQVRERLADAGVRVAGCGRVGEDIGRLLRLAGVGHVAQGPLRVENATAGLGPTPLDLTVAVPDGDELPALVDWNRTALQLGLPWFQVLPFDGRYAALGPLFIPGETCCYGCYRIRRASNSGYPDELRALERSRAPYPVAAPLAVAVAGLAATQTLRWIVERDASLPGVLHALEYGSSLGLTAHHVYRVPRCPACSEARDLAPPLPWFEGEMVA
jgi:bacteriocin biosynthesis cyclodehydratase domain-containing protein